VSPALKAGTQLAVVWSDSRPSGERMETLGTVLKSHELTATELKRSERARALRRFQSGRDWYRADAMDRLSEEEAGIIAARLLRRVQAKTPLPESKATMLRSAMTDMLRERFTGSPERASRSQEQERDDFLEKAAGYLNDAELASLREAFASGLRPLPGEQ
jgi:hypothetical protein